ncbi:MAG TPA: hypothetical protein PK413_00830 [Thermoanaerobaculia bacterium]|nr:hypothetical protein [Thermoanaerobaculia bacterium]
MSNPSAFPKAARFDIHSVPMFLLQAGDRSELLICKAKMQVNTSEPKRDAQRRRQIDVEVLDWVATGKSRMLGGRVEFRMTPSRGHKSWVRAGREGDLPGVARFAMRYQVTTPQGTVTGLTGIASGPISAFPPRGDLFKITKKLKIGELSVIPVACMCPADFLVSIEEGIVVG